MAVLVLNSEMRLLQNYKNIIFDLDGVLLDTEKLYARFWREAAVALGYPMTHEQALGMRSLNRSSGQAKLESYFGTGVSHPKIRQKRIELMDAYIAQHGVEIMPGVADVLWELSRRSVTMAIATSSPIDRVLRYFGPSGLLDLFDVVVTGYDVQKGKPAPDIYLRAVEALKVAPEACIAVEDSPAGLRSAYDAGCVPVFIPDLDELTDPVARLAYAKADHLRDLLEIVEGIE